MSPCSTACFLSFWCLALLPPVWHGCPSAYYSLPSTCLMPLWFASLDSTGCPAHPFSYSLWPQMLYSICPELCSEDIRRNTKIQKLRHTTFVHSSLWNPILPSCAMVFPPPHLPWATGFPPIHRTLQYLQSNIPVAPICWPLLVPHSHLMSHWCISEFSECEFMIF